MKRVINNTSRTAVLPTNNDDLVRLQDSGAHAMLHGSCAEHAGSRLRLPASSNGIAAGAAGVHSAVVTAEVAATAFEAAVEASDNP